MLITLINIGKSTVIINSYQGNQQLRNSYSNVIVRDGLCFLVQILPGATYFHSVSQQPVLRQISYFTMFGGVFNSVQQVQFHNYQDAPPDCYSRNYCNSPFQISYKQYTFNYNRCYSGSVMTFINGFLHQFWTLYYTPDMALQEIQIEGLTYSLSCINQFIGNHRKCKAILNRDRSIARVKELKLDCLSNKLSVWFNRSIHRKSVLQVELKINNIITQTYKLIVQSDTETIELNIDSMNYLISLCNSANITFLSILSDRQTILSSNPNLRIIERPVFLFTRFNVQIVYLVAGLIALAALVGANPKTFVTVLQFIALSNQFYPQWHLSDPNMKEFRFLLDLNLSWLPQFVYSGILVLLFLLILAPSLRNNFRAYQYMVDRPNIDMQSFRQTHLSIKLCLLGQLLSQLASYFRVMVLLSLNKIYRRLNGFEYYDYIGIIALLIQIACFILLSLTSKNRFLFLYQLALIALESFVFLFNREDRFIGMFLPFLFLVLMQMAKKLLHLLVAQNSRLNYADKLTLVCCQGLGYCMIIVMTNYHMNVVVHRFSIILVIVMLLTAAMARSNQQLNMRTNIEKIKLEQDQRITRQQQDRTRQTNQEIHNNN